MKTPEITERRWLYFALGLLTTVSVAASTDGLALRDDGIRFPDGTVQTTAAGPVGGEPVQGSASVDIDWYCSPSATLFSVPEGKRLVIEWMSATASSSLPGPGVDLAVQTWQGENRTGHTVAILTDSIYVDISGYAHWSGPVRLYSGPGKDVTFASCAEIGEHHVRVSFSGYLVDAAS